MTRPVTVSFVVLAALSGSLNFSADSALACRHSRGYASSVPVSQPATPATQSGPALPPPQVPPPPAPGLDSNSNSDAKHDTRREQVVSVGLSLSVSSTPPGQPAGRPSLPEVPTAARLTLFANFLGDRPGEVILAIEDVSYPCSTIDWRPESVTVELPCMGLAESKDAELQIVLPNGRIAKKFSVRYVPQPDVVVHVESIGAPGL